MTRIDSLRFKLRRFLSKEWVTSLIMISIVIGAASGVASIIFYIFLREFHQFFFKYILNYHIPEPSNPEFDVNWVPLNPFLLLVTSVGGLVSGILVYKFAPEAEGHGTDAAIAAFHRYAGDVRARVPLIKILASVFTIGSGGSAGREGPMAQIGSGVASLLSKVLGLPSRIRRLSVAVGIGAGIGSIFKAPLGGAIFGVEVLYKRDFEVEALLPAFIAAIIGYTIFGFYDGFNPIFNMPRIAFRYPFELLFYIILGIVCGLAGILYVKIFYWIRHVFHLINIPNYLKPALGGLITGVIGLLFPHILSTGYGWLTLFAYGMFPYPMQNGGWHIFSVSQDWMIIIVILIILALMKILATAFTIGSGGSGGVFAPGLFIGGSLGAALAILIIMLFPDYIVDKEAFLASFVIIGMLSLFGGVSNAPLAVLIMVSEMTGSYELIAPSMLSISISYFIARNYTIYPEQLLDREHAPAHWRA